ncbi:MAG: transposase [Spirochaetia bacterium]|jgi:transposase-like protein|nr:transposase [Spirochaetia bacterium]
MGKRRTYSNEMKEESVQYLLSHPEKTITAVAESLGIRRDEELFKLKRELADTKEERDILKKALAIFSKANYSYI